MTYLSAEGDGAAEFAQNGRRRLQPRPVDLSRVKPLRWAWDRRLVIGYLNLLVGDEGVGKGTFIAWLVARLTRGELPGDLYGKPARVLMVGDEDGWHSVTIPRLEAAGADRSLVWDLPAGDDGLVTISRDADDLRALLIDGKFDVVVFDQLLDNLGAGVDDWRSKPVREAIAPLRRLAADLEILALASLHTNKSNAGSFRQRVSGTQQFNSLSRSSLLIAQHPDDEGRRVVAKGKGNYAGPAPVVEFEIGTDRREINGHTLTTGVANDVRTSTITMDDILRGPPGGGENKSDKARQLIEAALADGGWHPARPILDELNDLGLSDNAASTIRNKMGVDWRKAGGYQGGNEWCLPRPPAQAELVHRNGNGS